jgi:hypothetical protein
MKIKIYLTLALVLSGSLYLLDYNSNNDIGILRSYAQEYEGVPEFCRIKSDPLNVCREGYIEYNRLQQGEDRPTSTVYGYLSWDLLGGNTLWFFLNTSDIIGDIRIYDPDRPNDENAVNYIIDPDKIRITPSNHHFAYKYDSYYDPDEVGDTGFIVVFQSHVVNFGSAGQDGEQLFYNVDMRNRITLPTGAGIVSYAPIDNSDLQKVGPDRYSLVWENRNREMDSKHDPLIIQVTYNFDEIYLQFTNLVYRNKIEKEKLENERNRINLLNATIQIIAILSVLASLLAILLAYLMARRKFDPEKQKARELPRRQATNIEKSQQMAIPIKRMLTVAPLFILLLFPAFTSEIEAQGISEDNIQWYGQYEIFEDNRIKLTIEIEIPLAQNVIRIWENMSNIYPNTVSAWDENGNSLPFELRSDHILINNPPLFVGYSYEYSFTPWNYSGILVFLDRFWLEYYNPNNDPSSTEDNFLKADINYNVVLPQGAIIYSASPSDKVNLSIDPDGRRRVQFVDFNRQIDAFHDAWESQVSYSFINVLEAIENLNVDFENVRIETRTTQELFESARQEILIFALFGIIAPIISFFVAYWVFRKKNIKEIERIQQQQEEQIMVETEQIESFMVAMNTDDELSTKNAMVGYYYLLINSITNLIKRDASRLDQNRIRQELSRFELDIDHTLLNRLLLEGYEILNGDFEVSNSQLLEYAEDVEELLKQLNGD